LGKIIHSSGLPNGDYREAVFRGGISMIRAISKYWWIFTLRGVVAIVFGLASLLWPALTLGVMVLLFGLFVLFDGGLSIVSSFGKGDEKGGWTLFGEGLAGLLACVIVLLGSSLGSMLWPGVAAKMLVIYIGSWALATGIFKVLTAIRIRREIEGEWMLASSGLVSILFGLILIVRSDAGVIAVAWLIGLGAMFIGILLAILGLTIRTRAGILRR
jgi:uncharacterized membrane protein HdeD (DUF308 family)